MLSPLTHLAHRLAFASARIACSVILPGLALAPTLAMSGEAPALSRSPFAPATAAPGATLFTRLDPAATGITVQNPYDDPQMWGTRYREFMGGGLGSGVAAGDFDGDGRVDLYVSTKTKPGRLYRNLGDWKFADATEAAGLAENSMMSWLKGAVGSDTKTVWRQGAVFADVNNDARLDLYVCRNNAPNLLYINQRDGTFTEEAEDRGLAIVDGSVVGAFADYDRDGWLDVFIVTNQVTGTEPAGRPDRLFRNHGDGRFTEVTAKAGISGATFGHSATWIDYDADGWPDLHVANDFSGPDRLYRNNGDGTFTDVLDRVVPHTPFSSMGADLADINNDGHFDLFVADMATTTREKDRRGLAASRDDVVSMAARGDAAPQYMRNALLLNTGQGVFGEAACWAGIDATDWTWSVRFEDFDNDGWADLHVTNGMVREPNNVDLLAQMMRALSDLQRISVIKKAPVL
ncbi:MAG TPA: VCBS repeat-containing protein, partial [Opitutus sp.]|nr:VCBS repeat-containing protein [Opitutus sp.]